MSHLLIARSQMAMSLAFHIIFAVVGITLPLMMVIAEWRYVATGNDIYRQIARAWGRGTAIMFAVGAVSGTVLSFELGLLWPHFMGWAGAIIGMPFSLEGFAFFTEAIFMGIYFHGWNRISQRAHLAAGVVVAVSGAASALFVVIANAWMNAPTGFHLLHGKPVDIDPIAAMMNRAAFTEVLHMVLAAYASAGFLVAGMHAYRLYLDRDSEFDRKALMIALLVGGIAAVFQPLTGDMAAREVAHDQPAKMAAFESLFHTQSGAPLAIGGIPDAATQTVRFGIEVPYLLSLMTYHDPHAVVQGLDAFAPDARPTALITIHLAFQIMVGIGFAMAGVALWAAWLAIRRRSMADSPWFLRAVIAASPLGMVAVEAGWTVTEVGRQPWIIYRVLRTKDAVTPMPHLAIAFTIFTTLYAVLFFTVVVTLWRQMRSDQPDPMVPSIAIEHL